MVTGTTDDNRPRQRFAQELGTLLDSIPDGYVVTDEDGVIVDLNAAACGILRLDEEAAIGRKLRCVLGEQARACYDEIDAKLRDGLSTADGRTQLPAAQGDVSLHAATGGLGTRRWLMCRHACVEPTAVALPGTASADPVTQTIDRCDATFARLLGLTPDQVVGRSLSEILEPEDPLRAGRMLKSLLDGTDTCIRRERMLQRPFDGFLWARITVTLVRAPDNDRPQAVIVHLEDIAHQKRLEEDLSRAQKLEVIGRMSGGIAHDFNNLLMGIMGGVGVAMTKLSAEHPAYPHIRDIKRVVMRGAELVAELLTFSAQRDATPGATNIDSVIRKMERMLRPLLGEDVELRLKLRAPQGRVRCPRAQIEQVLVNLVLNARDAMPHGGKIEVITDTTVVDGAGNHAFPEAPHGQYLVLVVRDTGTGIPDELRQRVFEPFFTTKARGRGTGLGLATVRSVVERAGGLIHLDSAADRGTSFQVWLPLANERAHDPPAVIERVEPRLGHETVLVVEDEPSVRLPLTHHLETWGYRVLEAASADQALEQAATQPVDLLITDIVLPGMQGPQLAATLKNKQPSLRVIYMSAYSLEQLVDDGRVERETPSLQKPFEERHLAAKLREALDARSAGLRV